eukprot:SAG22_NODE_8351_length_662_cov_0.948490_1_plen_61_part_10
MRPAWHHVLQVRHLATLVRPPARPHCLPFRVCYALLCILVSAVACGTTALTPGIACACRSR